MIIHALFAFHMSLFISLHIGMMKVFEGRRSLTINTCVALFLIYSF
jgi:low affinity Fe/Cu permease